MMSKAICSICGLDWAVSNRTIPFNYICPRCHRVDKRRDWRQKKKSQAHRSERLNKMTNLSIAEYEE